MFLAISIFCFCFCFFFLVFFLLSSAALLAITVMQLPRVTIILMYDFFPSRLSLIIRKRKTLKNKEEILCAYRVVGTFSLSSFPLEWQRGIFCLIS